MMVYRRLGGDLLIAPLIALIACTDTPMDSAVEPSQHPYTPDTTAGSDDSAALQSAIQQSIDRLLTINGEPIHSSYQAARAYGSEDCPIESVTIKDGTTTTHWQEVCNVLGEGTVFNGPMTTWAWQEASLDRMTLPTYDFLFEHFGAMSAETWSGNGLNGQTDIAGPDGQDFNCSCLTLQGQSISNDGFERAFIAMDGPSHWNGPEAEGSWMEANIQIQLSGYAEMIPESMNRIFAFGYAIGLAEDYNAIAFSLSVERVNGTCHPWENEELRSGSLQVRQAQTGRWEDYQLQSTYTDGCTTCTEDGSFCLDLSPLVDWSELPW